jgi:hypothetical protein
MPERMRFVLGADFSIALGGLGTSALSDLSLIVVTALFLRELQTQFMARLAEGKP